MNITDLLKRLQHGGIVATVHDGRLKTAAPKGAIDAELAALIRAHKDELVAFLQRADAQGAEKAKFAIAKAPAAAAYPLSFSQQRLWFIDRLQGGSAQYNIPFALKISGAVDRDLFQRTLDAVVARHDVLRTRFEERDGVAQQIVGAPCSAPIRWLNLSALDAHARERELQRLADTEVDAAFDLSADLMLRTVIVRLGAHEHAVLFTLHHIAADGWSMGVLVKEFAQLYAAFAQGLDDPLAPLARQYVDYAQWQRGLEQSGLFDDELAYWQEKLRQIPAVHAVPLDRPRPARQGFVARRHASSLDAGLLAELRQFAQRHDMTLFMLLQAALSALLARWSGERDIVIATPIAGRSQAEVAPLIGFFINTLVLRNDVAPDLSVADLLAQARRTALEAYAHQNLPFDLLIDALKPERSLAYNAVCQIKFVLQNHESGALELPGLSLEPLARGVERVRFDLDLTASEGDSGLQLSWTYKQELFDAASIARLAQAYERLLKQLLAQPQARLDELDWMDATQTAAVLALGQGPASTRHRETSLVAQFAQQAARTPDAIAARQGDATLSYAQLDAKANRLAQLLAEQGMGRGTRVGVHLDRSVELLIALLGVMKSGAAYVMLDTRQSAERLRAIVADADISVVLLDSRRAVLPVAGLDTVFVDDAAVDTDWLAGYGDVALDVAIDADDSAYVLYTSGSTGQPKGVEIRHGGLTDYCAFAREGYYAEHLGGSVVATSPAFDLTIPSLYVPLLEGGCVELMPAEDELVALAARLDGEGSAALLRLTPSHLQGLLDLSDAQPRSERHVFVIGGEAFGVDLARGLQAKYPNAQIYNHYGPTETVVGCSWYDVSAALDTLVHAIPIGRPMSNTVLLVLDAQRQPVPVGVAGELYIGGAGVAKGYLNLPELTAQKFVANPFDATQRLYRSGDRVRWLADGNLEFLGRLDDQVKIRGFRIELGDIESRLRQIAGVRDAAVAVHGEGQLARLVAYLVGDDADLVAHVTSELAVQLPGYLQPGAYVQLDRLPLTLNGKVDRKALPEPGQAVDTFVAPDGETEQRLAAIWAQILRQDRISAEANFFALGGHSLLATRIVSEIAKQFGKPVPVRALFEHSSVRKLAAYLDAQAASGYAAIARQPRAETLDGQEAAAALPLSFAQQRLWFIDKLEGGSRQYNMPAALRLRGELDVAALQAALDAIVARHEILRTRYIETDGQPRQVIDAPLPVTIAVSDLRELPAVERELRLPQLARDEAAVVFDLARDLMLRCRLVVLDRDEHALLFTVHHIACDGWSLGVLVKEFVALYGAQAAGREGEVPRLPIQYADYAAWQRERLQGEALQAQVGYWREQLAGLPTLHELPLDRPRPVQQRFAGARVEVAAPAALLDGLKALALQHDVSLFMLLHAAFAVLLNRWSGSGDIVVGTPIAGRLHPDLDYLIGFFINTLVLRTDLTGNPAFLDVLAQTRSHALAAYAHQEVPFDLLVDELKPARSLSHAPLFQVLFSMKNNEHAELTLPGLSLTTVQDGYEQSKFDLQLTAAETQDGLRLSWLYAQDLFEAATVARLGEAYVHLLAAIVASPQQAIAALPLMDERAADVVRDFGCGPQRTTYRELALPQQFAQQAARTPHAVAVRAGGVQLSYAQLDAKSDRVAAALRARGQGRGTRVGVHLDRSVELLIALLGVMKSGAAYVMLDTRQSAERLRAIVADADISVVLLDSRRAVLPVAGLDTVFVDDAAVDTDWLAGYGDVALDVAIDADDSAYVLYTSGSTGQPKGVEIRHGGLTDYCAFAREGYYAEHLGGSVVATSPAFDLTIPSLYVPLLTGGCVELMPAEDELVALAARLDGEGSAALLRLTPSHLQGLLDLSDAQPRSERHVFVIGGEAFGVDLARGLQAKYPNAQIYNHYGPTETVVGCSWYDVSAALDTLMHAIPIGRPMSNTALLVLDAQRQPVPVGVAGELYIGGAGVAKGYLNLPELTAQKFVANPFDATQRLYRSGDRVRWLADGTLEFLGRLDDQVKIRGFRIELGDIESRLRQIAGVRDAAVAVHGEGAHARLVAYLVGDDADLVARVTSELAVQLPGYLQPGAYVQLDRLPLTLNGKVDRKALPAPAFVATGAVAPRNAVEAQLAAIWQQVLRRDEVGVYDNFFEIGGDSILSIQVVARASQAGIGITTRQLFELQTVAELARRATLTQAAPRPQHDMAGTVELLPIQKEFLHNDACDRHHYNQSVLLDVPADLAGADLRAIVAALYRRHDALRLRFAEIDGRWQGLHHAFDDAMLAATCIDEAMPADEAARGDFVSRRCEHWQASLDLADGPLLRVVHFRGDERGRLLLVAHHIVIDGVSWRILLADLEQAYRQLQRGAAIQLAPKTSSFQQWGEALAAHARSAALAQEKAWWLAQYAQPVEALPLDLPGVGNGLVATTQQVSLQWSAQETRQLLQQCNRAYRTQINELLLAGVYLGLRRWTGAAALRIALEGHGRNAEPGADDLDLTQTVGWFTSLYPLTLSSPDEQVDTVVKSIKEHCRSVPGKGLGYGLLRHIAEDPALIEAEAGQRPALAFNYLGQADQSINEETFFQSAPEYAGASASARRQRRHPLVLKGLVAGGELRMTLEYSSERYHAQTMQRVAGYIVDGLRDVIAHCATRERASFTPSDFPLAQATSAQLDHWQQAYPGMTRLYPATSMQTGLYFHSQLDRSSYASQTLPVFRGVIDTQNFRRAWQAVIDRHDVFRTAFVGEGEQLQQLVVDSAELPWHEEDWRGMAAGEQALRLEAYRLQDRARGFDFRTAPLMRVALFRLDDDRHQLLWTHHHVLSDGWSMPVFYREVMEVYQALLERREPALPPAPPYERYIAWLQRQDAAAARGYWHAQLQHLEAPTALAVDKLPLSARAPGQREQAITLERADGDALQALAQTHRVTVNTLLQLAWAYLLHRYSGEDDVVFGVTVSGRPAEVAGIEQMIGLFINTIPFKVSFAGGHTLAQQLAALQADFLRANEFSHLSLAEIQRQSRVPAGTPLFDSLLVIGNYPIEAAMEAESRGSGLSVESKGRNEQTGYKLAFNIGLRGRVHIQCSYSGEDFDDATVARLLGHFARILQQMPQLPDQPIQAIPLIGDAERRQFALWNTLPANYPAQACIHELFEAQAARTPEALAAEFHGETLSYAQLNAQANRVAHHLRSLGVVPDTLVGLCAERSLDLIVGMLGILKAGAAYLPLDPDYPQDRIAYMLADSGVDIVLAQNDVLQTLPVFGDCTVLPLDAPLREMLLAGLPDGNVEGTGVHAGHLAYAIYTSGSTGQPKGVLIEHRNVVRLVASPNYVELSPGRVMAQASNSSFDAATFEIWGALANGMSLYHIGKDTLLDPRKLARALAQGRVSTLFVTTAVFNQMSIVDATGFRNLDCLLFGGEGVDVEAVNRVLAAGKPRHLMHVYGPTENTTFSTAFEIGARREDSYPIGTPISGTTQYVLDAQQGLVPVGVVGELYLGGAGVGRGYLKRPELTAERFVADPFAADGRGRLYRTGDLVRQLPDGAVQFVGRVDDQVKIRGFRIELGEIETRLLAHEAVCDAVVVARRDGGTPRLVAYVVCATGDELPNETLLAKEWRRHLKQRLPDYMLPAAFVVLDALPLTHNGKVDKRRLPEPDYQAQQVYVAPETETERILATIWQQVLRVEQVGIHDNFFEIGGDSILSIQLVSRANQAGIGITTKQLFEAQTVAELARLAPAQATAQAPQDAVDGELTLLPIHHYFFAGDATDRDHFNQAVLLETPDGFTGDALRAVMTAVYARHDALRLRFARRDGRWHASHAPLTAALIDASCVEETLPPSADARAAFISERCAHWQASFDLTSGPLLRAVHFAGDGAGAGRLLLAVHHIVVDGVSWRILLGDVEQAYAQHLRGDAIALAPKSASYQQWGAALAAHARSDALLAQKDYWLAQHAEALPPLPRDRDEAGNGAIATTRNVAITLTPAETRALQQHCHAAYRTQINELLLAGVYLGMRRWSGAAGLRLRLEGHGREDLDDGLDLSQTVGWFTSIYPLVLRSASAETGAVIKAVKEQYRAIPQRGLGYGVLRYLSADEDLAAAAAGQHEALLFNYLGQFDQVINETTRFQSAPESIGPQVSLRRQRAAQLGFSGKIFGGQLQCSLNYSSGQYDAATMQSLAAHIEDGLREVIRHCQQRDAGGFTPSDFPLAHVDQTRLDAWQADYPDLARLYPATPMQAGLLFESLLDRSAYVVQNYPILRGSLDTAAFREAWQQVIARHDIFRTAFVGEGEAVHQLVSARALLPWHEEDWRGLDEDEQRTRFEAYRSADRRRGFDFAEAPLLRIALLRLGDDRYQLLWTLHHILLDGWCLPLVYRDVIELYRAAVDGRAAALDPPPSYERYIAWLQARSPAAARAYWRETLGTFDTPTPLVVDRLGSDGDSGHREKRLELSVAQTQALQSLAQSQRTTVNTLVQWCWACLLHRYSGETDVVFGATISGRPAEVPGVEEMVGLFINTIPVKVSFAAGTGVADSVARLQADFQRSVEHGYLALPEIQRESRVRAGVALFDSLLVFENYPLDAISGDSAGSDAATLEIERAGNSEQTNFRLSLIASLGRTLEVKFGYRAEHFGDAAMQRLVGHFGRLLDQLPAALQSGHDIDLLDAAEVARFADWNRTDSRFPDDVCVHALIEAQVAATPDAIAVVADGQRLSYAELNRQANRLAHALLARGVRADDCVGLCMTRSAQMVVAILGILKAGAAYLPLDPDYPAARLDYMLRDSGAAWVLTQADLAQHVPGDPRQSICLDAADVQAELAAQPSHDPTALDRALQPHNLAYAIYTSGSTGEPKGVLNEHRALVNRLDWMQKAYALDASDRVLQKTPYSFDVSVWEFLWTLMTGARLVMLAPHAHKDPDALCAAIREHGITTLHFVPSMLSALLGAGDWASCRSVRQVICSGEALGAELAARFFATGTSARLHNLYGPTEAAIDVSYWECRPEHAGHTVPIGRPIQNIQLHVLDAQGRQQPIGVPGELHIGGVGLARGYCNKPELTAQRFIRDHIARDRDAGAARLYRTGDLARWMPDGTLDFLGRIDHQVKIRGLRIELGEIETLLCRQPGINDAAVVAHGSGEDQRLVAYVATLQPRDESADEATVQRLRGSLAGALPDYMVPAVFVLLERLPLSANGKIDRKLLPDPQWQRRATTPAGSETEAAIAAIWQRLLRLDEIDVLASFFELGGHSLLAVRMLGEVRLRFGVTLAIRDVFERTTVRALAAFVDECMQRESLRQGLALDLADSNDQELIEL